ncbi:hypothetical protein BKK81_33465 (plasmid) [Cupriavidus sp. USMAHM13]|nr:hypothetical protein BKK81_33465 [Cupriavidus sp. USMAHM13]
MNGMQDPALHAAGDPVLSDAQVMLAVVRELATELRLGTLGLYYSLERDFSLDSLARNELLARIEQA